LRSEFVIKLSQLLKKSYIGFDLPSLSQIEQGLGGRHVLLLHQVGGHDGGRPGVAQEAVDKDQAVRKAQSAIDEFHRFVKELLKRTNNVFKSFLFENASNDSHSVGFF
jgi:hypothetical protein